MTSVAAVFDAACVHGERSHLNRRLSCHCRACCILAHPSMMHLGVFACLPPPASTTGQHGPAGALAGPQPHRCHSGPGQPARAAAAVAAEQPAGVDGGPGRMHGAGGAVLEPQRHLGAGPRPQPAHGPQGALCWGDAGCMHAWGVRRAVSQAVETPRHARRHPSSTSIAAQHSSFRAQTLWWPRCCCLLSALAPPPAHQPAHPTF